MARVWKLSPSDLTFLWSECPRCFYLKVAHGFSRPRSPMPKIFNQIDTLITAFFQGKPTSEIPADLPDGIVRYGQKWVTSEPIALSNHTSQCYLKGRFDTVVEFSDGSHALVDFKTSTPRPEHVDFYSRQLHAYAYALEHPAAGRLNLAPITKLRLLVFEPSSIDKAGDGHLAYRGRISWLECAKDYGQFLAFIDKVLTALETPSGPPSSSNCEWCMYRDRSRSTEF